MRSSTKHILLNEALNDTVIQGYFHPMMKTLCSILGIVSKALKHRRVEEVVLNKKYKALNAQCFKPQN